MGRETPSFAHGHQNWSEQWSFFHSSAPAGAGSKERFGYTGLKIAPTLLPAFALITFQRYVDTALAACIALMAIIIAIESRWDLRKHAWFWATIVFIFALHVPLLVWVRLPLGNVPTDVLMTPIGIADFLIVLCAIGLAERFFSKDSS